MDIPAQGGRPTTRATADPLTGAPEPAPAPRPARAARPTVPPPPPPRQELVSLARARGGDAAPASDAPSTSRRLRDDEIVVHPVQVQPSRLAPAPGAPSTSRAHWDDEIVADPVRLEESDEISGASAVTSAELGAPIEPEAVKKYLDTSDLKNYLQYKALARFASDPAGAHRLRHLLHKVDVALPNGCPSQVKIRKLKAKIFKTLQSIEANHDKYLELLKTRRAGGLAYACSFGYHLRRKDALWQFAARAFMAAGVMGLTGVLMQFTYAFIGREACKNAMASLGPNNATAAIPIEPGPGNATVAPLDPSTSDIPAEALADAGINGVVPEQCDLPNHLKSAFLPKGTSPGAAVGVDLGIRVIAGTASGTMDARNELKLQAKNRARHREIATQRTGQAQQPSLGERARAAAARAGSAAGQSWCTHIATSTIGWGIELTTVMLGAGAVTQYNVARAAAVHYSGFALNTGVDAARDALLPDASESRRYWTKIAARMTLVPLVRQAIRSALDGEDGYGYATNIFAYGVVLGITHELEGALFYSLRENNVPPDEREENEMAKLIMLLGKLGIELENEQLFEDHETLPDEVKAAMTNDSGEPEKMKDLAKRTRDVIAPYFAELLQISDMLPHSPELQAAAKDLDESLPKDPRRPSLVASVRNYALGAPERERDIEIELGVIHESGTTATSHTTLEVEDEPPVVARL